MVKPSNNLILFGAIQKGNVQNYLYYKSNIGIGVRNIKSVHILKGQFNWQRSSNTEKNCHLRKIKTSR